MRSVLIGNGVTIQYGGADYLNSKIIRRALDKIQSGKFPATVYPKECAEFVIALQKEHVRVLNGEYDSYVITSYDRSSLKDFKNRYDKNRSYSVTEIGFEDYFLLFELVHNKQGIGNPDRFYSRAVLRRMFLDAIFNEGKIETIHKHFQIGFVSWLKKHDYIFTTNYDSNLENATGRNIHHLHGAFSMLSETYNPKSFRNQLEDDLLNGEVVDHNYLHLYSNCIVSYVGYLKSYSMTLASNANSAMEKFVSGYQNDPEIRRQIDEMDESNALIKRLKEAIKLKAKRPDLKHSVQYPHQILENISGSLEIIGLSPYNDGHLFTQVLENNQIVEIIFNYFSDQEASEAKHLFKSKNLKLQNVREYWAKWRSDPN